MIIFSCTIITIIDLIQSTYRPNSYEKVAYMLYGIILKAPILNNHSYLDIDDVHMLGRISPVGSTISCVEQLLKERYFGTLLGNPHEIEKTLPTAS